MYGKGIGRCMGRAGKGYNVFREICCLFATYFNPKSHMRSAWRLPRFPVMADKTSGRKKSEVFWSNMGICIDKWLQYLHCTCLTTYQF